MTAEEQRQPGENAAGDEVPTADPAQEEAHRASSPGPVGPPPEEDTSGPVPQPDELTVEDILAAEQSAAAEGASEAAPEDNVYLEDLRRVNAEYANYRKRTEANAELDRQRTVGSVVSSLLGVLDDLDRAEQHGDLEEGSAFATIATKVRLSMEKFGVVSFGEKGEPFDPQIHEAIAQVPVPGTESPTVLDVIERGYRIGDVELRPAKVAVAVDADG
ncbi:nucleotide exchange factor GrpE [Leucobacter sp. W1153]|uniref:nucleotide exchange factor GrpE n=1 Tax=Leucobacter sp. W1153 TaxID=3439064 RepID=UPI003F3542A5